MAADQVTGGAGCSVATYVDGPDDGSIVLAIHGIAQSAAAFDELAAVAEDRGWRLVRLDLRGHGESAKPEVGYRESQPWADDLAAVLADAGASATRRATLVGWSYGGVVIGDYLAAYGTGLVSGVVTLGATHLLGRPVGPFVQPEFAALTKAIATDETTEVLQRLLDLCAERPLPDQRRVELLANSAKCPAYVRSEMFRRTLDHSSTYAEAGVPMLVVHGRRDRMFTFALAEAIAALGPDSSLAAYDEAGHMPLWDQPDRFIQDLAAFIDRTATS